MILLFLLINLYLNISSITLPVWYQPPRFYGEPRLIENNLHWLEIYTRTGTSEFAYGPCGCPIESKDLLKISESITNFNTEVQFTHNLKKGFFYQLVLPLSYIEGNEISNITNGKLGDTLATVGWGLNYQDHKDVDFTDLTIQTGLVIPSGTRCNDLPCIRTGYDGKLGFVFSVQASLGLFDWLTIGGHEAIFTFYKKRKHLNIISQGLFIKADHLINGFSLIFAGAFNHESIGHKTKWKSSTLNVIYEYDFSSLHHPYRPTFGMIFDIIRYGKNVPSYGMYGFYFNILF